MPLTNEAALAMEHRIHLSLLQRRSQACVGASTPAARVLWRMQPLRFFGAIKLLSYALARTRRTQESIETK
jgi:hypothetical protein